MKQILIIILAIMMQSCIVFEHATKTAPRTVTVELALEGCHTKVMNVTIYKDEKFSLERGKILYIYSKYAGYRRVVHRSVVDYTLK